MASVRDDLPLFLKTYFDFPNDEWHPRHVYDALGLLFEGGKLCMDDIEGEEHRRRATKRQQLYEFVKLEAVRCMEDLAESDRPLLCAMGTPFDIDSIYLKLQDEGWKVIKVPAYAVPWDKIH